MNKKVILFISLCICLMFLPGCSLFSNLVKHSISGRVTFPDGNGVKGVKITLTNGENKIVETDDTGRWSLDNIKGDVTITPVKEGYEFEPSNLKVKAAGTNYNFTSTYLVQGQILFGNQALSDATISFGPEFSAVKTDEFGKWQREGLYSEVTITPSKDGYYFTPASQRVTDYSIDIVFQADQTYCASGRITGIDELGVADVTIDLGDAYQTVTTDSDGVWRVSGLVNEAVITPRKDGYNFIPESFKVNTETGNIAFLGIKLEEYYTASGKIVDIRGEGLKGVVLNFGDSFEVATTDANGMWSKEGLYGDVQIIPSKTGYTFEPATMSITGTATDLDFVGVYDGEYYTASGKIVDIRGEGLKGVVLNFGDSFEVVTTDANGIWSKEGLYSDVQIIPSKTGYTFEPATMNITGTATDLDFVGVYDSEYYTASGKIVDIRGEGLKGVVLNFGDSFEVATTDANGMWSKEGLYGDVQIIPSKTGYTFEPATMSIAGTATDLDFVGIYDGEYYTASGKVIDIHGQGISGVQVDFEGKFGFTTTDAEGIWTIEKLYHQVQVTPSKEGYFFIPENIILTENATNITLLGVRDDEVYTLTGKVVDPAMQGLAGVTIDLGNFGSVITDIDGTWSKTEVYGEITVTPFKESFTFEPSTLQGSKEISDLTFTGTYTASGRIYDSQGLGLTGVTLSLTQGFGTIITDDEGYWQKNGLYGDVVVTPNKDNYVFEPISQNLNATNHGEINFNGYQLYTVSGTVVSPLNYNQGLANVTIEIGDTNVKTDQNGNWSYTWREGSSITALPMKTYWNFEPAQKTFMKSAENVIFEAYPNRAYFPIRYPNLFTYDLGDSYYSGCIDIEMQIRDSYELLTVNEVRFYVDGELFDTVKEADYNTQLDTGSLCEGSHNIRVEIITDDCIIPVEEEFLIRHLHPGFYYNASQNSFYVSLHKYEDGTEKFVDDATVLVNDILLIPNFTNNSYKSEDETFTIAAGEEVVIEIEHPSYDSIVESITVPFTTDTLQSNDLDAWLNGGPDAELNLTWASPVEQCATTMLCLDFYNINGDYISGIGYTIHGNSYSIKRDAIYVNPAYAKIYVEFSNSKGSVNVGIENGCMTYMIKAVNESNVLTNLPLEFQKKTHYQTEQSDQLIKKELR